ncbi:MAG: hypothetical protein FJY62_06585 [Betaproteobacteria bacterium]|nr:hypothetical protein [Betaproteobacteria bacterium]
MPDASVPSESVPVFGPSTEVLVESDPLVGEWIEVLARAPQAMQAKMTSTKDLRKRPSIDLIRA